jgi:Flp pilus assembly protein TadD
LAKALDAAQAAFERALGLDRNFAETHAGLASVAAIRGQRAEAERLIEVAQRLDPKCLSAQFARSVLLDQGGKGGEARRVIVRTARNVMSERPTVLGRVIENATGR